MLARPATAPSIASRWSPMRLDVAAAAGGRCRAPRTRPRARRRARRIARQGGHDRGDAVALLHPQLGRAANDRGRRGPARPAARPAAARRSSTAPPRARPRCRAGRRERLDHERAGGLARDGLLRAPRARPRPSGASRPAGRAPRVQVDPVQAHLGVAEQGAGDEVGGGRARSRRAPRCRGGTIDATGPRRPTAPPSRSTATPRGLASAPCGRGRATARATQVSPSA